MKAAVLNQFGEIPQYKDFPDPIAREGESLVTVKAAPLENFDKMIASGAHYASKQMLSGFPCIIGHSGVGITQEEKTVAFGQMRPPYGSFAEKTVAGFTIEIPEGTDLLKAATLPSSILTSYLPLTYTAKLKQGETILINGATGVSGKIAVQVAKMLGAKRIIGTGRKDASLQEVLGLGAHAVIDLKQSDDLIAEAFKREAGEDGYDVIIDFIWGHSAEILLKSLIPTKAGFAKKRIRYIHIGEKSGSTINLSGEMLRTSGLELLGAGDIPKEALGEAFRHIWNWIKEDKFHFDIQKIPLSDVEKIWQKEDFQGKRIVIVP